MCEPLMLLKAVIYDLQKIRFASITSYGLWNINKKALLELALTAQHKKASRSECPKIWFLTQFLC